MDKILVKDYMIEVDFDDLGKLFKHYGDKLAGRDCYSSDTNVYFDDGCVKCEDSDYINLENGYSQTLCELNLEFTRVGHAPVDVGFWSVYTFDTNDEIVNVEYYIYSGDVQYIKEDN